MIREPNPGTIATRFGLIVCFPIMMAHSVITRIWETIGDVPCGVRADISGDLTFFRRMWRTKIPCQSGAHTMGQLDHDLLLELAHAVHSLSPPDRQRRIAEMVKIIQCTDQMGDLGPEDNLIEQA